MSVSSRTSSSGHHAVVGEKQARLAVLEPGEGFCTVLARALAETSLSRDEFAPRLFMRNESSLRNWEHDPLAEGSRQSSPPFDELLALRKRGLLPARLVIDAAQLLLGDVGIVSPATAIDLPGHVEPATVLRLAIEALPDFSRMLQMTNVRVSDGDISADEAASFAIEVSDLKRKLDQAALAAQRCARRR